MPIRHLAVYSPAQVVGFARGVFYGWWLVGMAGFILMLESLALFQGLGILVVALERQFAWSRTALSGSFAVARVVGAILGPVQGLLIDRMGSRLMLLIGYIVMGLGFVLLSQVTSVWQFYVSFIVIGVGYGVGGWLATVSLVNNWFVRRRSLALAIATSGVHFGAFLVPVLALGVESHGFRMTTLGVGVFMLVMIVPVAKLVRNRPEEYGLRVDGQSSVTREPQAGLSPGAASAEAEPAFTARQALATGTFWTLAVAQLASSASFAALALHLVPKLTDIGLSLSGAGVVVVAATAAALPTQLLAGYLADRTSKNLLVFAFLMLQAASLCVLALAENAYMAFLFAVLYGVALGGRMPILPAMIADYFGRRAFATVMGLTAVLKNIAMLGGPLFAGYMFDRTESYIVPFATIAALSFLGGLLMLQVRRPPHLDTALKEVAF